MNTRWRIAQFFEIKWWIAYLRKKDKPEYMRKKKVYWERLISLCEPELAMNNTGTIIDMGCGPAGMYVLYDKQPITAVDPLLDIYEKELPIFSKEDYPNVAFICSTIEDFKTNEEYDYVFCMNAINHVADINKGFGILTSLAKKTGTLVVTIDAHNYQPLKHLFRFIPGDILHPHQYDVKEYSAFLEKNGCEILKTVLVKKAFIFNYYLMVAKKN